MKKINADHGSSLVADVLAKHWRVGGDIVKTDLGISRATWRVNDFFWLSQSGLQRRIELKENARLMAALRAFQIEQDLSISSPEVVASVMGELIVVDGGYGWCLTRHLPGVHPDAGDPSIYPALAEGLARFHRETQLFLDRRSAKIPDGICVKTRTYIAKLLLTDFVPFTEHPKERELLLSTAEWLLPRLNEFEALPRQISHGDWTPHNVLFGLRKHKTGLTAVLDLESMALDPVHVDVASTCSTLLMWSGLDDIEGCIDSFLNTYEGYCGYSVERRDVFTAMLAHWFCHYWHWRDRMGDEDSDPSVKKRLCTRIARVLEFVSKPSSCPIH